MLCTLLIYSPQINGIGFDKLRRHLYSSTGKSSSVFICG
jgi:hypothetical protein